MARPTTLQLKSGITINLCYDQPTTDNCCYCGTTVSAAGGWQVMARTQCSTCLKGLATAEEFWLVQPKAAAHKAARCSGCRRQADDFGLFSPYVSRCCRCGTEGRGKEHTWKAFPAGDGRQFNWHKTIDWAKTKKKLKKAGVVVSTALVVPSAVVTAAQLHHLALQAQLDGTITQEEALRIACEAAEGSFANVIECARVLLESNPDMTEAQELMNVAEAPGLLDKAVESICELFNWLS